MYRKKNAHTQAETFNIRKNYMIDKYCFEYLELMLPELHLNVRNPTKLIPAKLSPKFFYVISRISMSKAKTLLREFFF